MFSLKKTNFTNFNDNNNFRHFNNFYQCDYNNKFELKKKTQNLDIPRNKINLENIIRKKDKRTTIMIKNLPRNLNSEIISSILLLEKHINYLYIPVDSNNGKILGFAFVNMKKYINILEFIKFFEEKWKIININGYNKKFQICYSSVQGIKVLKQTFGNYIVL